MWGKTIEPEGGPPATREAASSRVPERSQFPAAVSPKPRMTATVGQTMRIRAEISSDEELYLDGDIEGDIDVRDRLTIGPNGKVKANVKAKELVVFGSIHGDVEATGRIAIMTGASIVGDVKTAGIVIEDGAYFKGGIDILHPENKLRETAVGV